MLILTPYIDFEPGYVVTRIKAGAIAPPLP